MAEVFLGSDQGAHGVVRPIVLKRILPHLAQHASMTRMFLQEARLLARLHHPHVVTILEFGEDEGTPFIAMEYVPGSTLRDLVVRARQRERVIPAAVALHLCMQACAGAHAAHELTDEEGRPVGLVHRDLSPHNLMVDPHGHVKLLDFGIAKLDDDDEYTRPGTLKGKVRYMSPEQCRQEPLDRRSDVFALAIVLWELLTGERPFERPSEVATMNAVLAGERSDLRALRHELPEKLVCAIERALIVDPARRTPSADAFRRELADAAAEHGLLVNGDATSAFVGAILGSEHEKRRVRVQRALLHRDSPTSPGTPRPAPTQWTNPTRSSRTLSVIATEALQRHGRALVLLFFVAMAIVLGTRWWSAQRRAHLSGPAIVIGLPPEFDAAVMRADYEPLLRYLESRVGRPFQARVAADYDALAKELTARKLDFAVLPPYAYLDARRANPKILPVAVQEFDRSSGTDGVILVDSESELRDAAPLRGKTLCLTNPRSSTGFVLPRAWLRTQGLRPGRDVQERLSGNHFDAMRDLLDGHCAAAATYSGAWLVAERAGISAGRLRVIANTGRTPHDALVAGPSVDDALRRTVETAVLELEPTRDLGVERIGDAVRITGFLPIDDARYDDLRRALEAEGSP
jgi:phosphate/phosphite/phosphonate ABC transporter binding protein